MAHHDSPGRDPVGHDPFRRAATVGFCRVFAFVALASMLANASAQEPTRDDILRGALRPERTCFDVIEYHLDIRIEPERRFLSGSNQIVFDVVEDCEVVQIDLFANMEIEQIVLDGEGEAAFTREENSVFVELPIELSAGDRHSITVHYSGSPIIAARPPWSGGFTWTTDDDGNPWVVVTCQGTGASLWWPNKDHPADEPDSMTMSITVPPGLDEISNGRLVEQSETDDGWTKYVWAISYPINNYNVTINIGKYAHFSDEYISDGEVLTLDYYVLPANLEKAKEHFEQTKTMLRAFEKFFGPYPFPNDGFKMIESPHLGMEHQSAIAYGNQYLGGYLGRASSEVGYRFDFIIIHEAAHEWWGNSVSKSDAADMWIHESFGAYAESLYVEEVFGYDQALEYINGKKSNVRNRRPIIGEYNVNQSSNGDMYDKGQLILNTLRSVIDDDENWFEILLGIQTTFKHQNVTGDQIIDFINEHSGRDFDYFFDQYYRHAQIPRLRLELNQTGDDLVVRYRWEAEVDGFDMPVQVTTAPGELEFIHPTDDWQTMTIDEMPVDDFQVAEDRFYIDLRSTVRQ